MPRMPGFNLCCADDELTHKDVCVLTILSSVSGIESMDMLNCRPPCITAHGRGCAICTRMAQFRACKLCASPMLEQYVGSANCDYFLSSCGS